MISNLFEDKFLNKYKDKFIVLQLKQNQIGGNTTYDRNKFKKMIDDIEEKSRYQEKVVIQDMFKRVSGQYVEKYVVATVMKYSYDNLDVYILSDWPRIDWYYPKSKKNVLPTTLTSNKCMYINMLFSYTQFEKQLLDLISYVKESLQFVNIEGDLLIYTHLIFFNSVFYNFIEDVANHFEKAVVYYPKFFQKKSLLGYIVFQNKLSISKSKSKSKSKYIFGLNKKDVNNFMEQVEEFTVQESEVYYELLKIYNTDKNMFKVVYNKYNTASLLSFYVKS